MANLAIVDKVAKTPTSQPPQRNTSTIIKYTGNFGATEGSETTVDIIPVDPYRSVLFSVTAASWGTATVAVKMYPCDSQGNIMGTNAFFSLSLTANGNTVMGLSEMGGNTTTATWPPATPPSTGIVVGPFFNFLKITEQCTAFTSGTNTVTIEVDCKG